MTHIINNLYLGGKSDVTKDTYDVIFSVLSKDEVNNPIKNQQIIRMDDTMEQDITDIIRNVADALETTCGKVLIHCHAGVSRSATLVIGYLMLKHKMTFQKAYLYVKMKRNICPNNNFLKQLNKLCSTLNTR